MRKRKLIASENDPVQKASEETNSQLLTCEVNLFVSVSKVLLIATLLAVLIDWTLSGLLLLVFLRTMKMNHKIVESLIGTNTKQSSQKNHGTDN